MALRTQKRRRLERKTDYKLRLGLLKSGLKRIVLRKTNKYVTLQIVESLEAKDKVLMGVSSKELLKSGWDKKFSGSLKSIPAAYLTGILLAKKADKKGDYIVDIGMSINKRGGRLYSAIKGLIDGGVNIRASKEVFPSEERLNGEHLKEDVKKMILKVREKIK